MLHPCRPPRAAAIVGLLLVGAMHGPRAVASPEGEVVAPTGVFVSAGPSLGHRVAVDPGIPFARGTLIRVEWRQVEPAPGVHAWEVIDAEVAAARAAGQKIALCVVNGPSAPAWLYEAPVGARSFSFAFRGGRTVQLPLPWDEAYLTRWCVFVAALGARYDAEPTVALVHMTNSSSNGCEMPFFLAPPEERAFRQAGYTEELFVASWTRVINAFAAAFPTRPLDHDVHPVLRSDGPAERITRHGHETLGRRYGVSAWWFSPRHARVDYPGMMRLLKEAARRSFATVQLVASAARTPQQFGDYGPGDEVRALRECLELARTELGRDVYVEIWPQDLANPAFAEVLRQHTAR